MQQHTQCNAFRVIRPPSTKSILRFGFASRNPRINVYRQLVYLAVRTFINKEHFYLSDKTSVIFVYTNILIQVAVKILKVKKQHLLEEDATCQARDKLYREAYALSRLNVTQHPNFPVLICHDTKSVPYHLITKFEMRGDLLQVVRLSRGKKPNLSPTKLLNMLIDISKALLYLQRLGLVHRVVMAENVLVGETFTCKLSGLHSLQKLPADSLSEGNIFHYTNSDMLPNVLPPALRFGVVQNDCRVFQSQLPVLHYHCPFFK